VVDEPVVESAADVVVEEPVVESAADVVVEEDSGAGATNVEAGSSEDERGSVGGPAQPAGSG
jgi:hypothetical protein